MLSAKDEARIEHQMARFKRREAINTIAWAYANKGIKRADRAKAYELCRDVVRKYVKERDPTTEEVKGLDVGELLREVKV